MGGVGNGCKEQMMRVHNRCKERFKEWKMGARSGGQVQGIGAMDRCK